MDLIERYLHDVRRRLPSKLRDEVTDELRASLHDALEDESNPTSESAAVAVLQQLGPPQEVVASYYPASQYLIGPELYPHFRSTTKIVFTALSITFVVLFVGTLLLRPADAFAVASRLASWSGELMETLFFTFGLLVLIFAGLQRIEAVAPPATEPRKTWNPLTLPAVGAREAVDRFGSITAIVVCAVLLGLLGYFGRLGQQVTESLPQGLKTLAESTFIHQVPWIAAALSLTLILHLILVLRGSWRPELRVVRVATDLFGLYVLWRVVSPWMHQGDTLLDAGLSDRGVHYITLNAWIVLAIVAGIILWDNLPHLRALLGRRTAA